MLFYNAARSYGAQIVRLLTALLLIALREVPLAAGYPSGEYAVMPGDLPVGLLLLPPFLLREYMWALPFGIVGAATASALAYTAQTMALLPVYRRVARVGWPEVRVPQRRDRRSYARLISRLGGATG